MILGFPQRRVCLFLCQTDLFRVVCFMQLLLQQFLDDSLTKHFASFASFLHTSQVVRAALGPSRRPVCLLGRVAARSEARTQIRTSCHVNVRLYSCYAIANADTNANSNLCHDTLCHAVICYDTSYVMM